MRGAPLGPGSSGTAPVRMVISAEFCLGEEQSRAGVTKQQGWGLLLGCSGAAPAS